MTNIQLHIHDAGDPSVGIQSTGWAVDCPFVKEDSDKETLEWFRKQMLDVYKEFAEGKLTAQYSFEIEAENKAIEEIERDPVNLCTCTNCEEIFIDSNPQSGAPIFMANVSKIKSLKMVHVFKESGFWGCPNCKTDAYLSDHITKEGEDKLRSEGKIS